MKVLTKLKNKQQKYKKIMGFDIETSGSNNDFVLACFYSDDIRKVCRSKQEVIDFLDSSNTIRSYKIYATNLQFDFLGTLYENSDKWSLCERNGTIYSFKWYQDQDENGILKNSVTFLDTMRILPFSVEKLGKILGVPKMDHPSCFAKVPKNLTEELELTKYCMNDAKISYLFIKNIVVPFLDKYNIPLKTTIGSISLADFRTNFLEDPIFQETEEKREIAFKSYYGGRTETFQRGLFKNVFCFDVNSLYPSAMLEQLPDPNRSHHRPVGDLKNINKFEGVSEVLVEVPTSLKIPPLPYKRNGRLIFPTGTFKGYYNHIELRNAMKYGVRILGIYEQLIFTQKKAFFKPFIEHHYKERLDLKAIKSPLEVMEKAIMNNLYGKFAFNYKKGNSLIPEHDLDFNKHISTADYIEPCSNGKFFNVQDKDVKPPVYSFPIWSSYITSIARIKMYEYLADQRIQDKILSTDTDSIFIKDYANEIPTSNELGAMKLEDGYPVEKGYFIRPKFYNTHKPKCKGVRFTDDSQFFSILKGEPIAQERFIKFRTAVRSSVSGKYGKLVPNQVIEMEKQLDLEDTKRLWAIKFNPFEEQYSKPITINWEQESLEEETRQTNANAPVWLDRDFITTIVKGEQDLVDFTAKGHDISKEEYLENEISIELLD